MCMCANVSSPLLAHHLIPDWTKTLLLQVRSSYQSCKTRWLGWRGKQAKRSLDLLAESFHRRHASEKGSLGTHTLCTKACIHKSLVTCPLSLSSPSPPKPHSGNFLPESEENKPWAYGDMGAHPARADPARVHLSPRSHGKPHGLSPSALRISC